MSMNIKYQFENNWRDFFVPTLDNTHGGTMAKFSMVYFY